MGLALIHVAHAHGGLTIDENIGTSLYGGELCIAVLGLVSLASRFGHIDLLDVAG
jgi:hypothetical protein